MSTHLVIESFINLASTEIRLPEKEIIDDTLFFPQSL